MVSVFRVDALCHRDLVRDGALEWFEVECLVEPCRVCDAVVVDGDRRVCEIGGGEGMERFGDERGGQVLFVLGWKCVEVVDPVVALARDFVVFWVVVVQVEGDYCVGVVDGDEAVLWLIVVFVYEMLLVFWCYRCRVLVVGERDVFYQFDVVVVTVRLWFDAHVWDVVVGWQLVEWV